MLADLIKIAEKTHLGLAFLLGMIVCVLLGVATYGIYRLRKPTPAQLIQQEFDRQVEQARVRRSQAPKLVLGTPAPLDEPVGLPPLNPERIVKVFKRVDDTPTRVVRPVARVARDDEPTGRFTREKLPTVE